jgi:hypothetical protein
MDKDTQATRASPDATTVQIVTGPTLPAPALEMIGKTEGAPAIDAAPEAAPSIDGRPDLERLAERVGWLEYDVALLANGPAEPPEQEAQQATAQEIPAPVAFLFATSTATLSMSKEAVIALVVLVIALAVIGGGVYLYCRSGGHAGAPASA